uniref:Uncharacterized protein n=1 Tax=Anguilla anguilla TaxID=7936 RepID=A0A0E9RX06_ANGAN
MGNKIYIIMIHDLNRPANIFPRLFGQNSEIKKINLKCNHLGCSDN